MTDLALSSAISSLMLIEKQMSVTSSNISNANTAGYTAESVQVGTSITSGVGSGVVDLGTVSNTDPFLLAQINTANGQSSQASTYNTYYQNLQQAMGQIGQSSTGGNDIASQIATLQTDLSSLASTPQNSSLSNSVISGLDNLTSTMRSTSQQIQSLRTQADQQISDTVDDANTQLDTISSLNTQIATAQANGQSTAALQDQRNTALNTLSGDLGVTSYTNAQGEMQVYTSSGQALIDGNQVNHLSHDSVSISDGVTYPGGGINGIMVGQTDITSTISTGTIAALVQQRDGELPATQSSLDYLAQQLSTGLNAASNLGSASPPPSTLTSAAGASYTDGSGSDGTTAVTPSVGSTSQNDADGFPDGDLVVRIALTDSTGEVQSSQDLDLTQLGSPTTVGSIIGAINTAFGGTVTASLNSSGGLKLTSNNGQGLAVSTLDGSLNGTDFSSFFHLNDVVTGGNSAGTISVNSAMLSNSSLLPVGTLNSTMPAPTAPFSGVGSGDGSTAQAMSAALLNNQTFTSGTGTGTAVFSNSSVALPTGTFTINGGSMPVTVQVTNVAGSPETMVTVGGNTTVAAGSTLQTIVDTINTAASAAGIQTTDPTTGDPTGGLMASVSGNGFSQIQINSGSNSLTFSNVTGSALSTLGLNSSPTGHLGAQTTTYGGFASNLISDVASRATDAQTDATSTSTALTALQSTFSDESGVNVDQQTAMLTQLQNLYAASARVITTQTAMFNSLITAIGG